MNFLRFPFSLNKKRNFHWQCQMKQAPSCLWVSLHLQHKEEINAFLKNNPSEAWQADIMHITLSHIARKYHHWLLASGNFFPLQVTRRGNMGVSSWGSMELSISNTGKKATPEKEMAQIYASSLEFISFFPGIFSSPFQNPVTLVSKFTRGKKKF